MPDYFLPRVSDTRRPRVVVCYEQGHLVGVVYTEELLFAGRATGWVFGGDRMGRGLVLAAPEREAEVIATACEYLLANGVHALRLWWRSTGNEILPVLQLQRPGLQVWCKSEIRPAGRLAASRRRTLRKLPASPRTAHAPQPSLLPPPRGGSRATASFPNYRSRRTSPPPTL